MHWSNNWIKGKILMLEVLNRIFVLRSFSLFVHVSRVIRTSFVTLSHTLLSICLVPHPCAVYESICL